MQVSRKGKPRYRRAENGTKVTGDSEGGVRAKKFSEMQDVARFMDYTYNLPNVRRAIEQYSLGGGTWQYPNPSNVNESITAPRPRPSDLDFAFDESSVGPMPEGIYHMENAYAPQMWMSGQGPISLAEAKRLYEQKEPPPESDMWGRRRWERGREHYMDMMGIRGDFYPTFAKDRNWYEGTEERDVVEQLRKMFPNEPEETFQSVEGLSSLMAKRASDELSLLQNFRLVPEEDRSFRGGSAVQAKHQGTKNAPLMMGLAQYQRRGSPQLSINPNVSIQSGAHELSHVLDTNSSILESYLEDKRDKQPTDEQIDELGGLSYVYSPTETRARIMGLRWNMYHNKIKDPSEVYTAEDVARLAETENKGGLDLERLRLVYSDETIAELLNNAY